MDFKNRGRLDDEILANTYKCPCGHSVYIDIRKEYNVCSWCGRKLYKKGLIDIATLGMSERIKRHFKRRDKEYSNGKRSGN